MVAYRLTNTTVYPAKYYIIWCPRYRRRLLGGGLETRRERIIDRVVAGAGGEVIEVEVMADQVHLLVEVAATVALSKLVQSLKGRWSRVLRAEFGAVRRGGALWSPSWLVSTVAGGPVEGVGGCVENRKRAA
jgi:putative transposase